MFKSRTLRRIFKRLPGGKTELRYEQRKPSKASCGRCGAELHGVPRENPSALAKLPKSSKRPERAFGGVLCSRCQREIVKYEARDN